MSIQRLRIVNDCPPRSAGDYILYWMIGARRTTWNFALDRAVHWARELQRPLVVLEALRADYRWASDRLHQFAIDGMRDNAAAFARAGIGYYPYLEPHGNAGRGLLRVLADRAAVVVTDDTPVFDLSSLVARAARVIPDRRFEAVDSNGILPIGAPPAGVVFSTAYAFRRYLQRQLPSYLSDMPSKTLPRAGSLPKPVAFPADVRERWPPAADDVRLAALPIDHTIAPVDYAGGSTAGRSRLKTFIAADLPRYADDRNNLDDEATSRLSPYLHWGHVSAHQVVHDVLSADGWHARKLGHRVNGAREGWWGASAPVEAFLDELITWRELGFHTASRVADYQAFETLPAWAMATLERHANDPRAHVYTLDEFADARSADPIWNAAQRQLREQGRIHNYLRMLWGKKILEWTASPREALEVLVELNNRYAVDGRDPNSYSGIMWTLGRYDRPWPPERKIFGRVRYMSSENTARKLRLKGYLQRFGGQPRLIE